METVLPDSLEIRSVCNYTNNVRDRVSMSGKRSSAVPLTTQYDIKQTVAVICNDHHVAWCAVKVGSVNMNADDVMQSCIRLHTQTHTQEPDAFFITQWIFHSFIMRK